MINPLTGIIGGTAALGLVTSCWGKIKVYAGRFYSLFIVKAQLDNELAEKAVCNVLWKEFKWSKLGTKIFLFRTSYVRPERSAMCVAFEKMPKERTVFRKGWRFITVTSDNNAGGKGGGDHTMEISFIRGMFKLDGFLQHCVDEFNRLTRETAQSSCCRFHVVKIHGSIGEDQRADNGAPTAEAVSDDDNRIQIYRPLRWNIEDLGQPNPPNPMNAMVLSPSGMDAFEEAKRWMKSGDWFKNHFVPWKRGWLLYGAAGTGKTSFVRAMAQHLDLPVVALDLPTMTNQDLDRGWDRAIDKSPCIVLMEDIDAVFDGRKNVAVEGKNSPGLSFDCLLNTIDGVENTDGVFLILTTNHPDKLDPALAVVGGDSLVASRPGRVDRMVEFGVLEAEGRLQMAERILGDLPPKYMEGIVECTEGMTGAQLQEYCARIAMKAFWEDGVEIKAEPCCHSLIRNTAQCDPSEKRPNY